MRFANSAVRRISVRWPIYIINSLDKTKRDENSCQIIDVAIPEDERVRVKEDEKVEKYQDLAREWNEKGLYVIDERVVGGQRICIFAIIVPKFEGPSF